MPNISETMKLCAPQLFSTFLFWVDKGASFFFFLSSKCSKFQDWSQSGLPPGWEVLCICCFICGCPFVWLITMHNIIFYDDHWPEIMIFQKSNELKLKVAWDRFMNANDRWKDTEAQKQAKVEIKVCNSGSNTVFFVWHSGYSNLCLVQKGILKRIEEKERERDSYELHVSNMNLAHIDERDKNMVMMILLSCFLWFQKLNSGWPH